jgi:trehalose/maltose hydrolase-like predicted phosphorylase
VTRAPGLAAFPDVVARRFEAIVFDWDGTAVTDRTQDATSVRAVIESLCAEGIDVAVVSGTHVGNVDGQLAARPRGPGRLLLALNRGSELFEVGADGPQLVGGRVATPEEDAALTRAADATVARLAAHGLETRVVSQRLNRRKIDLIPLPEWADPPKAQIDELLLAVQARLRAAGIAGLEEVAALAADVARSEGVADPKVTSDAKHVEIGLTDKADSARAVFAELWRDGIAAELVLVAGDEFGPLGGMPGSDSLMLVPEAAGATVFSVGVEPSGVPAAVLHLPGGPARFLEVLHDQRRRRADVPRVALDPEWSVLVDGVDPARERARDSLLTVSDGMIGTSGAPLMAHPAARREVLAAGMYDGTGPATDLMAGPNWAVLDGTLGAGAHVTRVLDLHTGTLREQTTGSARVDAVRFSSLARPGVAVLRADLAASEADDHSQSVPLADGAGTITRGVLDGHPWVASRGDHGSITAAAAQAYEGARIERIAAYDVRPGEPAPAHAVARVAEASQLGFEYLYGEHRRAWSHRWAHADVSIDGAPELQRRVRVALFHLMGAVGDRGEAAVGARGLTGHGYRGHVFWDADLFTLPFLAATHPAAARAMLEYRIRRLPAAYAAARAEHHEGARFAWESATTGDDVTPLSIHDAQGRAVPIRTGHAEVHIVADVAWAAGCYLDWTGDAAFENGPGRELFIATARYWASRIHVDHEGVGHLFGVIGPDEYHEPVDDNAYTNVLARWNLRKAAALATSATGYGETVPHYEIDQWRMLADALVDGFDPASLIYEEFAGFYALDPLRISDLMPRPVNADLVLGREPIRRGQVVKQADVLMLHHLLPGEMAVGSLQPNLDFYEPRTAHGSSLSPGIHSSLFARAGRLDRAVELLQVAAAVDADDVSKTGDGGVHLATMGSVWQALAYGFMGLRPAGNALEIDPRLPDDWSALGLHVQFQGAVLALRIEPGVLTIDASRAVVVDVSGTHHTLDAGMNRLPIETSGALS